MLSVAETSCRAAGTTYVRDAVLCAVAAESLAQVSHAPCHGVQPSPRQSVSSCSPSNLPLRPIAQAAFSASVAAWFVARSTLQPAGAITGQVNETYSAVVQQAFNDTFSVKAQWCVFVRFFVVFHVHHSNKQNGRVSRSRGTQA